MLVSQSEFFTGFVQQSRPTMEKAAMHHAHSARISSACLSRQMGAALVDSDGTFAATGVDEVSAAGGGAYGEGFGLPHDHEDRRCAFRETKFCSSNRQQNKIIDELIGALPELATVSGWAISPTGPF